MRWQNSGAALAKAKALKGQYFLFSNTGEKSAWQPPTELPDLTNIKELAFDTETTGKNKRKDLPIGLSFRTDSGLKAYLPWNHAGGNLEKEKVQRWCKKELRNKKLIGLNIGFDAEVMLRWGVDLEAQGNQLYDIAHAAALLNENRYSGFNLADLGLEYCRRPKMDEALDKSRMQDYHSSMVGDYAEEDANLTWDVYKAQRPLIAKDKLERVDDLESKLIWANNHMERSCARIDVEKLHRFSDGLSNEVGNLLMHIWQKTGVRLEPNKNATWDKLFVACGIDPHVVSKNAKGKDVSSYTDEFLMSIVDSKEGPIKEGLRCRRLLSLKSKYFDKYEKTRIGDLLPFNLYQLRAGEEEQGTVVGRYSSANVNIQQVFKVANQVRRFGEGYIVRELMIPDEGYDFFTADGSQLQFRLFAHLSKDKNLINAYQEGYQRWLKGAKDVDFHQMVADLFSMNRDVAKNQNFGLVMGLGRAHLASWLGLPCNCATAEHWKWNGNKESFHQFACNNQHSLECPARQANDLADQYDTNFPSAKQTMEYVVKYAKNNGYVPSMLGRRRRYAAQEVRWGKRQKTRYYKALASWLQGSEADIVKSKILRVYNERNSIGIHKLRMPVHDEITGDLSKDNKARQRLREVLNIQELPCRVPITWADEYGPNWRACSGK
jgi:DNA polymerase I